MLNFFKVLSVFVTVVAVALMGIAISTFAVAPDLRAEMNTPAMQNYTFERTSGEEPKWTVTRRFSTNPADPDERGAVGGPTASGYDALIKAHQDLRQYLGGKTTAYTDDTAKQQADVMTYQASQAQDTAALAARIQELTAQAEAISQKVQENSRTLQTLSVQGKGIRDETAARRTDVLRLRHELEELRTDLFRLTAIRRDLTDRLLRVEIENQELADRQAQLTSAGGGNP